MKIGITGGTGFIGQCLIKNWSKKHQFTVLCIEDEFDSFYSDSNVEYCHSEFSVEEMQEAFSGCDGIVNLGGVLSTPDRETGLLRYDVNIEIAEKVFMAAEKLGIKNVVNISSRTVYNHSIDGPYQENDLPQPLNLYAVAKLAVENISAIYNRKCGMRIKNLRFAQVFGPGGRNGYMMEVFKNNALSKETLTVIGNQGKELLYVKDAARAIICALEKDTVSGIFNIGTGVFILNSEIAEAFCKNCGNEGNIIHEPVKNEVTVRSYMDVSKAKKELGFGTQYDLESAIADMIREENREHR